MKIKYQSNKQAQATSKHKNIRNKNLSILSCIKPFGDNIALHVVVNLQPPSAKVDFFSMM
jgi:hypothetical protein